MLRWGPVALITVALFVAFNVGKLHGGGNGGSAGFGGFSLGVGVGAAAGSAALTPGGLASRSDRPPLITDDFLAAGAAAGSPLASALSPPPAPAPPTPPAPRAAAAAAVNASACAAIEHTELAGAVVRWGEDHRTATWQACCAACAAHTGPPACNSWVFCADAAACGPRAGQCWLKQQALFAGVSPGIMAASPTLEWTSGWLPRYTAAPTARQLGLSLRMIDPETAVAAPAARERECGSPAADAYASVDAACLESSRTAREFDRSEAGRLAQVVWAEKGASYDGLAVAWGIGHKQPSAVACADACRRHVPDAPRGPARLGGQFGAAWQPRVSRLRCCC
jgi:hypothetical protein